MVRQDTSLNLRINTELKTRIKEYGEANNMPMGEVIRILVEERLDQIATEKEGRKMP